MKKESRWGAVLNVSVMLSSRFFYVLKISQKTFPKILTFGYDLAGFQITFVSTLEVP